MNSKEVNRRARTFLADAVSELKLVPFDAIRAWPEHPPSPSIKLNVPQDLLDADCTFTLLKNTLPSGDIEIAVQYRRYRFLGFSYMMADGFVLNVAGAFEPLSRQTIWDLT